jgi:hypothetical protein
MIEMSGYLVGNSTGRSEGLVPLNDLIDIFRGVPEKFVKIRSIRLRLPNSIAPPLEDHKEEILPLAHGYRNLAEMKSWMAKKGN